MSLPVQYDNYNGREGFKVQFGRSILSLILIPLLFSLVSKPPVSIENFQALRFPNDIISCHPGCLLLAETNGNAQSMFLQIVSRGWIMFIIHNNWYGIKALMRYFHSDLHQQILEATLSTPAPLEERVLWHSHGLWQLQWICHHLCRPSWTLRMEVRQVHKPTTMEFICAVLAMKQTVLVLVKLPSLSLVSSQGCKFRIVMYMLYLIPMQLTHLLA